METQDEVPEIIKQIKKGLDEANLPGIMVTPVMYDPETLMPVLGVLVQNDNDHLWRKKYTISVTTDQEFKK